MQRAALLCKDTLGRGPLTEQNLLCANRHMRADVLVCEHMHSTSAPQHTRMSSSRHMPRYLKWTLYTTT